MLGQAMTTPSDPFPKPSEGDLDRRRRDLEQRLEAHERRHAPPPNPARSDLARGLKLSSEFIAGIVVGALLGYLFDLGLGTSPFGLIVFLMLGFGAGILNVLRETGQVARPESRMRDHRASERPGTGDDPR